MRRYSRFTETITLASGGSATSKPINCIGARRVHISVSCDVGHLLTTGDVRLIMSDAKIVSITPLAYPSGSADATTHDLSAAGVITGVDLSAATHRGVTIRPANGNLGDAYCFSGADYAGLSLTKAATAGNAVYTLITTVYWD